MASNITVSGLVVAPGVQHNFAQWEVNDPNINGLPYRRLKSVELHAATENNRALASMVAEGITSAGYVFTGLAKRYHWIRAKDVEDQYGEWYPSGETDGVAAGGVWQDFATTIAATSGSISSSEVVRAQYYKIGPNVTFVIEFWVTGIGTGSGHLTFTLPVAAKSQFPIYGIGPVALMGVVAGSSGRVYNYDGSYPIPFPTVLNWFGTYEADE